MKMKASQFSILIRYNPDDPNHIEDPYLWTVVRGGNIETGPIVMMPIEQGRTSDYMDACLQADEAFRLILLNGIEKPKARYTEDFD